MMAPSSVAAARPPPTLPTPPFYSILIGLSIMTLSTTLFGPIVRSLSGDADLSTHLYEAMAGEPLKYASDAQLSSLLDRFEAQVSRLEALMPAMAGMDTRPLQNTVMTQADRQVITCVAVFLLLIIKLVGLVNL